MRNGDFATEMFGFKMWLRWRKTNNLLGSYSGQWSEKFDWIERDRERGRKREKKKRLRKSMKWLQIQRGKELDLNKRGILMVYRESFILYFFRFSKWLPFSLNKICQIIFGFQRNNMGKIICGFQKNAYKFTYCTFSTIDPYKNQHWLKPVYKREIHAKKFTEMGKWIYAWENPQSTDSKYATIEYREAQTWNENREWIG